MRRPRRRELRDIRSMYPFPSEYAIVSRICRLSRPSRSAVAGSVSSRGGAGSGNLGISILRKPDGSVPAWPLIKGRGALAPLDYYYAPGCGGVRMVKRFMLTPCWAGRINSGTVLTPPQTGATRCCGSKAYLSSAVTEPLEPLLRAQFGHSRRTLPMIAVTEP